MKGTANYDGSCLHMKFENILQFTHSTKCSEKKTAKSRAEEEQQKSAVYHGRKIKLMWLHKSKYGD